MFQGSAVTRGGTQETRNLGKSAGRHSRTWTGRCRCGNSGRGGGLAGGGCDGFLDWASPLVDGVAWCCATGVDGVAVELPPGVDPSP